MKIRERWRYPSLSTEDSESRFSIVQGIDVCLNWAGLPVKPIEPMPSGLFDSGFAACAIGYLCAENDAEHSSVRIFHNVTFMKSSA